MQSDTDYSFNNKLPYQCCSVRFTRQSYAHSKEHFIKAVIRNDILIDVENLNMSYDTYYAEDGIAGWLQSYQEFHDIVEIPPNNELSIKSSNHSISNDGHPPNDTTHHYNNPITKFIKEINPRRAVSTSPYGKINTCSGSCLYTDGIQHICSPYII